MEPQSALIVVDMQEGIFRLKQPVHDGSSVIANTKRLVDWSREHKVRLFFSQHENSTFLQRGSPDWRIIDELNVLHSDQVIRKRHPGIFKETELYTLLKNDNIARLFIVGLISNGCVRDACLDALRYGFEVVLVRDAHSTFYRDADSLIQQVNREIEGAGASVLTTADLIAITG